jgi:hypothetical protein
MRKLAWLTCTTLALTLGACGDDGDSDDNNTTNDPSSSSGDPVTMTDPSTTMTDPSTTMTDPSTTMTDPTDPSSSSGDDPTGSSGPDPDSSSGSDSGSDSGTTGGDVCAADVEDDECTTCTKGMCCDELTACYEIPNCQCVVLCSQAYLAENPKATTEEAVGACTAEGGECDAISGTDGPAIFALSGCVNGMCGDSCGAAD